MSAQANLKAYKVPKARLPRPSTRHLVRWTENLNNQLLLAIQSACNHQGVKIPWNEVAAETLDPRTQRPISEGAIIQHLAKMRIQLEAAGLPVPGPLKRGGKHKNTHGQPSAPASKPVIKASSSAKSAAPAASVVRPIHKPVTRAKNQVVAVRIDNSRLSKDNIAPKTVLQSIEESDEESGVEGPNEDDSGSQYEDESGSDDAEDEPPRVGEKRKYVQTQKPEKGQDADGEYHGDQQRFVGRGASFLPDDHAVIDLTEPRKTLMITLEWGKNFGTPENFKFNEGLKWCQQIGLEPEPHDIRGQIWTHKGPRKQRTPKANKTRNSSLTPKGSSANSTPTPKGNKVRVTNDLKKTYKVAEPKQYTGNLEGYQTEVSKGSAGSLDFNKQPGSTGATSMSNPIANYLNANGRQPRLVRNLPLPNLTIPNLDFAPEIDLDHDYPVANPVVAGGEDALVPVFQPGFLEGRDFLPVMTRPAAKKIPSPVGPLEAGATLQVALSASPDLDGMTMATAAYLSNNTRPRTVKLTGLDMNTTSNLIATSIENHIPADLALLLHQNRKAAMDCGIAVRQDQPAPWEVHDFRVAQMELRNSGLSPEIIKARTNVMVGLMIGMHPEDLIASQPGLEEFQPGVLNYGLPFPSAYQSGNQKVQPGAQNPGPIALPANQPGGQNNQRSPAWAKNHPLVRAQIAMDPSEPDDDKFQPGIHNYGPVSSYPNQSSDKNAQAVIQNSRTTRAVDTQSVDQEFGPTRYAAQSRKIHPLVMAQIAMDDIAANGPLPFDIFSTTLPNMPPPMWDNSFVPAGNGHLTRYDYDMLSSSGIQPGDMFNSSFLDNAELNMKSGPVNYGNGFPLGGPFEMP